MDRRTINTVGYIATVLAAIAGLWLTSRYSYLLFHTLAELFTIAVAGAMFAVAWNSSRFSTNGYLTYLSIAFLSVAGLDLLHTLAFKGLGVFPGHGANLPTQLWIAARGMQSLSLLIAPLFMLRRVRAWPTLLAYLAATAVLLAIIFPLDAFPACYIESGPHQGLTSFKIGAEYVICMILIASVAALWPQRKRFSPADLSFIVAAIGTSILSELAFTRYISVYGDFNMLGHLLKVVSFLLFYKAMVAAVLKDPYQKLFRDLKEQEEALRRAHDELELRVEARTEELREAYEKLKEETTERERAESRLRQAQKMEALGTLTGGIAHDFNNILAAMIGFTELIKDDLPPGNPHERFINRVLQAGLRGRDLIKQMLTFSRRSEQEKKPFMLSSITNETVKLLRASTPSTISIKLSIESESGLILGDPVQIQQVIMNLCTNAAYAMQEKGGDLEITLRDFSVSASGVNHQGIKPGLYMQLVVRDTGVGISRDVVDRIFDPFFTTKRMGEGTGLGLSMVMGIVKQSNGYITVESEPGKGSAFTVSFPKVTEKLMVDAAAEDEQVPTGSEHILFVDDELPLVEMGEELLAGLGYQVTCRTSSREALALVKEDPSRFNLVITDQTMPDISGLELAREILSVRPDMPVILCTGFSHLANAESAKTAGIKGFLMKPLTKSEISKVIRKTLDTLGTKESA